MNTCCYHTSSKIKISAIVVKQLSFNLILLYFKSIFCNPNTSNPLLNPVNEKIKMKKKEDFLNLTMLFISLKLLLGELKKFYVSSSFCRALASMQLSLIFGNCFYPTKRVNYVSFLICNFKTT